MCQVLGCYVHCVSLLVETLLFSGGVSPRTAFGSIPYTAFALDDLCFLHTHSLKGVEGRETFTTTANVYDSL